MNKEEEYHEALKDIRIESRVLARLIEESKVANLETISQRLRKIEKTADAALPPTEEELIEELVETIESILSEVNSHRTDPRTQAPFRTNKEPTIRTYRQIAEHAEEALAAVERWRAES